MAITVDWGNKNILVPKADTTLISTGPPEIRELSINDLRQRLDDLMDDVDGMPFDTTHEHTAPLTIGNVTLVRVVEIINNYTIEFEDLQYTVQIVGGNSNISEAKVQNQVSIDTANSAGQITGLDDIVETRATVDISVLEGIRTILDAMALGNVAVPGAFPGTLTIRDADDTKDRLTVTVDSDGTRTVTGYDKD